MLTLECGFIQTILPRMSMAMAVEMNKALWTAAFVIACALLCRFLRDFWWRPRALAALLRRQGIHGPPHRFMMGNMVELMRVRQSAKDNDMEELNHDILEHVLPDYYHWSKKYAKRYVYWWGTEPRITVSDPEMIREVLSKKPGQFGKSPVQQAGIKDAVGYGLVTVNGDEWTHHRRVVAPAFYLEKLKGMIGSMAKCTSELLDKWEMMIHEQPELEVSGDFSKMTADIISHTAFGSNYLKGKRVFELLTTIPDLLSKVSRYDWLPGCRLIPFPANLKIRKLQNELKSLLLSMIKGRRDLVKRGRSNSYGNDLLGLMLAESDNDKYSAFNNNILVDECKTFYLAGHETTATLLTWTMLMLAAYPEWQERARAEVQHTCKDAIPDADMLSKLKLVGMVLNETLRLYPPAIILLRGCFEDTKIGDLYVPKGAALSFPVLAMHHDPELWGADANEFNPERFKDGIAHACKHPNGFMPFSFGPRVCVGQSFALMEAKVALAMILRRFSFQLSPNYRHNPASRITLKPFHGLQVILKKL